MRKVLDDLASEIRRVGWSVEIEPRIESRQPDLVVTTGDGTKWVVEVKSRQAPLHMGDLGQMVAFREAVFKASPNEDNPDRIRAVIVTNDLPTDFFLGASNELGIDVFTSNEQGPELARDFGRFLAERT